jgi:hypothetical protein
LRAQIVADKFARQPERTLVRGIGAQQLQSFSITPAGLGRRRFWCRRDARVEIGGGLLRGACCWLQAHIVVGRPTACGVGPRRSNAGGDRHAFQQTEKLGTQLLARQFTREAGHFLVLRVCANACEAFGVVPARILRMPRVDLRIVLRGRV